MDMPAIDERPARHAPTRAFRAPDPELQCLRPLFEIKNGLMLQIEIVERPNCCLFLFVDSKRQAVRLISKRNIPAHP